MKKSNPMTLLSALVVLASAGYYVTDAAPQAGLELEVAVPTIEGCYAQPTGLMLHDGTAFIDTVMVSPGQVSVRFPVPDVAGPRQYRALAFTVDPQTGTWNVGRVRDPETCSAGGDSLWSNLSNVIDAQPRPGQPGTPVTVAVVK